MKLTSDEDKDRWKKIFHLRLQRGRYGREAMICPTKKQKGSLAKLWKRSVGLKPRLHKKTPRFHSYLAQPGDFSPQSH